MSVRYGRWAVLSELGSGGQGSVYLACDSSRVGAAVDESSDRLQWSSIAAILLNRSDCLAAVKVRKHSTPKAISRFEREMEVLRDCGGVGLATLLEGVSGKSWFATRFYENGTVSDMLDRAWPDLFVLQAIRPIVTALERLHGNGVVHRDIKPGNIFVDQLGQLVLGDCGIAFSEDRDRVTATDERVGSRDWMAPWLELGRADEVRAAADCYSVGKVIWAMLSGKRILPRAYALDERLRISRLVNASERGYWIDALLERTVVDRIEDCIADAVALRGLLESTISALEHNQIHLRMEDRPCERCCRGTYRSVVEFDHNDQHNFGFNVVGQPKLRILACSRCGHVDMFYGVHGESSLQW